MVVSVCLVAFLIGQNVIDHKRNRKNYERALKMVPMLIHLPPMTDDIEMGGRDERDVINEQLSQAQVMYSILSSTLKKGLKNRIYGQRHLSFEVIANNGVINYYAVVPAVLTETIRQAVTAAYPTAELEEVEDPNFFSERGGLDGVSGGEFEMKKEFWLPIATYEMSKVDASLGLINAMSTAKKGDGIALQILLRPTDSGWTKKAEVEVKNIKDGKKTFFKSGDTIFGKILLGTMEYLVEMLHALWKPPETSEHGGSNPVKEISETNQAKIEKIIDKTRYPGFEVLIRILASSDSKAKSDALLSGVISVFSQFDDVQGNGFKYNLQKDAEGLVRDYTFRAFPQKQKDMILNAVEMSSLFHLPAQNAIPTSQVERQATKQVDGPARYPTEGILIGINEFRGETKPIYLTDKDRRRHTYIIGQTGMGKSVLLTNIAYQDMCDGRGFCFVDPHGDAVETLLAKVPPERMDDVILFDPSNIENPVGMNMFEYQTEDQKDFIVQEVLNILISLYDPDNQGIFGPRAQQMFRNAALLLLGDPKGATFIDVPKCFIDPEFVKSKIPYITSSNLMDYWTKQWPQTAKSSDSGELIDWFNSKWDSFINNKMMRNILGQVKSGFNIREIMDNKKILLVNLSKGTTGEFNSKLLGMIFVMKFQAAAMSRADTPENERVDFCLYVDEFQNFSTDSFESILSEARKYRLNLIVANQFMTQLTDKIREAVLGNVGSMIVGRVGMTDAKMLEDSFAPVFNAQDLSKTPNHHAIEKILINGVPTSPFTVRLPAPMGDENMELMKQMKIYAASKYGRPRAEVEKEIEERLAVEKPKTEEKKSPQFAEITEQQVTTSRPIADNSVTNTENSIRQAEVKEDDEDDFLSKWMQKRTDKKPNESAETIQKVEPVLRSEPKHAEMIQKPEPISRSEFKPRGEPLNNQRVADKEPISMQQTQQPRMSARVEDGISLRNIHASDTNGDGIRNMTGFSSGRIRHAQPVMPTPPPVQNVVQNANSKPNNVTMAERGQDGSIILKLR